MIVKYQDKYWLYDGQRNGELLKLKRLGTGRAAEAAPREVEIMKTKQQLAEASKSLRRK
jgi:hypothetical protein